MNKKPRSEFILFLICVAVALAPLLLRGTTCGQDFDFHFESWMECAQQWHQGILYPHWITSANYGAGEPRFIFYPPLSWMFGALLGILLPWKVTQFAFTLLVLLAMGAAFYKMAAEWMPKQTAACAATLYILSPYIFFVIYERSAYAEFLAAVWFPLLMLYALRQKPSTPQLSLAVAALWLTNAPAAVMGSYTLALVVAVAATRQHSWKLVLRAAVSMALGLGLAAIYLIPAIYEQKWVEIKRAISQGMRIEDSFLFEHTGFTYHDQVLRTVSWIAVLLILATTAAAIVSWRARKQQPLYMPLVIVAALIIFLQFPVSRILWHVAPKLQFLQFPWRWLLVLGLIFATLAGLSLTGFTLTRRNKVSFASIAILVALLSTAHAWRHFWLPCDDEDNVVAQVATLNNGGFEGTDEYTSKDIDNGDIQQDLPEVRVVATYDADQADSTKEENPDWDPSDKTTEQNQLPASIKIERWQPEHRTATIQSAQAAYAILRLMDYPAWQVRINGKLIPFHTRALRDDGLVNVPIPAGTTTIDVIWRTTPDIWAGRIVSLLSLLFWIALWRINAANTRQQQVS